MLLYTFFEGKMVRLKGYVMILLEDMNVWSVMPDEEVDDRNMCSYLGSR
jgi:hypothetical protein